MSKKNRKRNTSPDSDRDALRRAKSLAQRGRLADAVALVSKALSNQPGWAEGYTTLGDLYLGAGDLSRAFDAFREAVKLDPARPHDYYQMGVICFQAGKMPESAHFFHEATSRDLKNASAWRNLAIVSNHLGKGTQAALAYVNAYVLEPGHQQTLLDLSVLFSQPLVYNDPALVAEANRIEPLVCTLFERSDVWHQGLAPLAGQLLCQRYDSGSFLNDEDRLARVFLGSTMNVQLALEPVLLATRARFLGRVHAGDKLERNAILLLVAMALQCFNNEYIWACSQEEKAKLEDLKECLRGEADKTRLALYLATYAMYRPVCDLDDATRFAQMTGWKSLFKTFLERTLTEPLAERLLRDQITCLAPIQDGVSMAVQEQYEEHPFPRWVNLGTGLKTLSESYRFYMGEGVIPAHLQGNPKILIAGCGTGQHPLAVAHANPNMDVTALDLSKASLAYATRKAQAMKIRNVRFFQADILQLSTWEQRFDHIESMGVLHHLQDPLAGWRVLRGLLRDSGTMRIGLYSELARQAVVQARELIAQLGIPSDSESIALFRQRLIEDPKHAQLRKGLIGIDFFSTSMLRDLIFHVSEHRYTIPQLMAELEILGLTFLGFELPTAVYQAYQSAFPRDEARNALGNWHQFEEKHPDTFKNMYNFWVQA